MKSTARFLVSGVVVLILLIFIKSWYFDIYKTDGMIDRPVLLQAIKSKSVQVEKNVTLILRYTPDLSRYLLETIYSFLNFFPHMPIVIVCDTTLEKSFAANVSSLESQVNVVSLKLDLLNHNPKRCIENYIKTESILIVPLGVAAISAKSLLTLIKLLKGSNALAAAVPVNNGNAECLDLDLNLVQWTIEYKFNHFGSVCDVVKGDHAILMHSRMMQNLSRPFMLPFPESFYIQSTALGIKVKLVDNIHFKLLHNFAWGSSYHIDRQLQRQLMYDKLKVKRVIRETGLIEWYGCTRETFRCFGSIIDSVPEYLNEGRWTPPCCLRILRETVRHVVKILKAYNVTFWLEGGSLLGAMRMKDIIPWDYDVDIGIYLNDIPKCPWLRALQSKEPKEETVLSILDNDGFVWEESRPEEGKFYRVHASTRNRLHVDIFPFYSRKGIMTKETWFTSHPQDKEFPEHYLQPLTTIEFAGIDVPAPNNIREFLELKFGKGCVENPQYPHPELNPFPPHLRKFALLNETKNYEA